nr:ABC transporter substrate-binding protein [uncultured Pseudogulbenkiania sp.]
MKPPELDHLESALRTAAAAQDWERLTALDARLSAWLAGAPAAIEPVRLARFCALYREILAAGSTAGAELEQRLALLSQEREGQLAYAQARQWEGA